MKENRFAYLFLCTIPLAMAFSSVAGFSIGSIRHTGLYWMATGVAACVLLPLKAGKRITFPWWSWLPFYFIMFLSLQSTRLDLRDNLQLYFQISVIPLVGLVASYACTSEEIVNRLRPLYAFSTILLSLFCVYYMVGPGRVYQVQENSLYQGFAERPAACSLMAIAALFLGNVRAKPFVGIGMWLLCMVTCLVSESRMATLILLLLWLVHPTIVGWRGRFLMLGLVFAGMVVAFNTPVIQERFFTKKSGFSGQGSIEDVLKGKFDSAGRFDAWPQIYEKSFDRFWTGHGVGESAAFVFRIWAPMDKPHNEYLKMFFEGGIFGLAAFVFGLLGTLANLLWNQWKTGASNWVNASAIMAWVSFILMSFVDNCTVYGNNFLHPTFFLVGAANGITVSMIEKNKRKSERNRFNDLEDEDQDDSVDDEENTVPELRTKRLQPIGLR